MSELFFAARWSDLELLKPTRVSLEDDRGDVVLIKTAQSAAMVNIAAFVDRCTHADIPLSEGSCSNGEIECPAHGARFSLATGAVKCAPAIVPLKPLPLEIRGAAGMEEVWVGEP